MRKKTSIIIFVIILMFSLVACGKQKNNESVAAGKEIIRISHSQPKDHPEHLGMVAFKEYIEKNLGDKYQVLIYANELLGNSKNAIELCQTGALDFVVASATGLEPYNNIYAMYSLPYLFNSVDSYFYSMNDDEIVQKVYECTEDQGIRSVTWFNAGTRNFYGNKPIKTVEDLKGMKIRVQPSPTNVAMMQSFGAGAVPLPFSEVYTALQNGTIDAAENNEVALTTMKHGEVAKYFSYDLHQIIPDFLIANVNFLDGLSDEEKKIFEDGFKIATEVELSKWDEKTNEAIEISKNKMGVEFIDSDVNSFKEKVIPLHEKTLEENPEMVPFYKAIEKMNEKVSKEE